MNPLADLCKQLGLARESIADLTELEPSVVSSVLSNDPPAEVAAYLKIADALAIRFRLTPSPSLAMWFDLAYLDGLYDDNGFRKSMGLAPVPKTRGELRDLVVKLAETNGPTEVTRILERSLIPTAGGLAAWNKGTIPMYQKSDPRPEVRDEILQRPDWVPKAWREWILDLLMGEFCWCDPVAFVRYGFSLQVREGMLIARSSDKIPAAAKGWIIESLQSLDWLTGHWGMAD